jgi:hypothetical protein
MVGFLRGDHFILGRCCHQRPQGAIGGVSSVSTLDSPL